MDKSGTEGSDDQWWRQAERRARRAHRWGLARRRLVHALLAPVRFVAVPRQPRTVAAVAAVALLGVVIWFQRDRILDFGHETAASDGATVSSVSADTHRGPTDPFAGTPAASYPKGAAGVVLPAATAIGGWTKAQVAGDLRTVRTALVVGHLDKRVLVGHRIQPLLDMMAPDTRHNVRKNLAGARAIGLLVRIAPGAHLSEQQARVKGSITLHTAHDDRHRPVLEIIANYVWVYAFADHNLPVVVHDRTTWRIYQDDMVRPGSRGLWPHRWQGYQVNIDCAQIARGLLAPAPQVDPSADWSKAGTEDPDSLYRPDHSLQITQTCRR